LLKIDLNPFEEFGEIGEVVSLSVFGLNGVASRYRSSFSFVEVLVPATTGATTGASLDFLLSALAKRSSSVFLAFSMSLSCLAASFSCFAEAFSSALRSFAALFSSSTRY
jgi:hypothetical protein